ncbi:MAG: hypothetical protein RIB64_21585 [Arenibacter algicola]
MRAKLGLSAIMLLTILMLSCKAIKSDTDNPIVNPVQNNTISVYCDEDNNLYQLLLSSEYKVNRYENIDIALEGTLNGQKLLILAKNYPEEKTVLPEGFFKSAKEKNLKVYVEFPDRLSTGATGEIKSTEKERLVVTSDFFGAHLKPLMILDAGLYKYVNVPERASHLKGAKVAGFKNAVYGLENTPNFPILFEDGAVLVSTAKLSDFNKSRYSPHNAWRNAIGGILSYLSIDMEKEAIQWEPIVRPTYTAKEHLPQTAYELAVQRGVEWYIKGRFLIHPEWKDHWRSIDTLKLPVGSPVNLDLPSGDGSLGVMEGHYSDINPNGRQPYRYWVRSDCVGETAMTFAIASSQTKNKKYSEIATNIMDFIYNTDVFKTPASKDKNMSSYGLIGWAQTHKDVYYGDNDVKVIIGAILSSQLLGNNKWDKKILEEILASFRTTGIKGFRGNRLSAAEIEKVTWQGLMKRDIENPAPHYESWLWATYLWLYDKTGYQPLLDRTKRAIEITMTGYPDKWIWANGIQQERARMILPLAWLVRVEDTEQNRKWLNMVCDDLLKHQVESGAIREELGEASKGKYGAPKTNKDYGTTEAPVIHTNGEPVADMLYTSNFAFFALNEAAQVTKDSKYIQAVDKLADFLVRIQSKSTSSADMDGCWFRAFDYENWEYYGSNADHGWGPWGTITGWTQSFITTTLALKLQDTSYWEITKDSEIGGEIETVWSNMLPNVKH